MDRGLCEGRDLGEHPGVGRAEGALPTLQVQEPGQASPQQAGGSCPGRTPSRTHRHLGACLLVCPRTHVGTPGGQVGLKGHPLALALCLAPPAVPGPPALPT